MEVYLLLLTLWSITIFYLLFLTVDSRHTNNCQLMFKQAKDSQTNLLKSAELLTITIELVNVTNLPDTLAKDSYLFQPLQWKRISGTHGKGLLQLKPVYEMLSLSLLSHDTEETSVTLLSKPQGCVENLTELEYENVFRKFLLNFTKENDEICNEHIGEMSGYARFYHECCQYDHHGNIQCNRVLKNKWMQAIQYCTYIVIIIVVLYCPLLIPSSLYDPNYGPKQFVHYLNDPFSFIIKTKSTSSTCLANIRHMVYKPYATLKGMTNFKKTLKEITERKKEITERKDDKVYKIKVSKMHFNVPKEDLLTTNEVPISLCKLLYDLFFKCSIRKQLCVNKCCEADICGKKDIKYPWYRLLRLFLRIVLSVAVCLPWVLRIAFFYIYEYEIRESRHKAAETRNLLVRIENSLAYYGTPIHVLFILSYSLLCFGYIFLELTSMILFKKVKCLVREILTKCFDGMYSHEKIKHIQESIRNLFIPCRDYGIFGLLLWPPYWICAGPYIMVVTAYLFFPAVHIIVNFFYNFVCVLYKHFKRWICKSNKIKKKTSDEKNNNWSSTTITALSQFEIGIMFILLCLMLSSLLLTVELVIFLISVVIYTMVGVILNSSHAMQYISIISLAWLYYRRCFGGISQIYMDYNKAVQRILYTVNKQQLDAIAKKDSEEQENMAFEVIYDGSRKKCGDTLDDNIDDKNDEQEVDKKIEKNKIDFIDEILKFKTNSVIVLLDKFDKQYITKEFFFKVCRIKPEGPGSLRSHFLTALRQFGIIIIFLIFVTLVVLAFGDSYSLTFSNQLLATLAGGVVPWILMKTNILFAQTHKIDTDKLVERYFSDKEITNEMILTKIQTLQKSLQEMIKNKVYKNEEKSDKTTKTNVPKPENSHQLKHGKVIVKRVFKQIFNEKIGEDVKWWDIADIDGTYEEYEETRGITVDLIVSIDSSNDKTTEPIV